MIVLLIIALLGTVLLRVLPSSNIGGRLAAIYFLLAFAGAFPILLSMVASNVAGFTKKSTVGALLFIAYCAGNIARPQIFVSTEYPRYDVCTSRTSIYFLCSCKLGLPNEVRLIYVSSCLDWNDGYALLLLHIDPDYRYPTLLLGCGKSRDLDGNEPEQDQKREINDVGQPKENLDLSSGLHDITDWEIELFGINIE